MSPSSYRRYLLLLVPSLFFAHNHIAASNPDAGWHWKSNFFVKQDLATLRSIIPNDSSEYTLNLIITREAEKKVSCGVCFARYEKDVSSDTHSMVSHPLIAQNKALEKILHNISGHILGMNKKWILHHAKSLAVGESCVCSQDAD